MLKSSKINHSTKRKAKNSTTKAKKHNLRKSQNLKNTKITKTKNVQQKSKLSHIEDICVSSSLNQLHSHSESSSEVQSNNILDQNNTETSIVQNKNSVLEIKNSNVQLSVFDGFHLDTNEFSMRRSPDEIFNLIYTGQVTLTLPSRSWSIHYADIPVRCIVISEITLHNDSGLGFVPLYTKQIIFYENMNYDIFLFNAKTFEKNLSSSMETIADVMDIIAHTNNLKLCRGGPDVNLYNNVNLECAYRDNKEKWRHNLCSLEVSEGDTCELCLSLDDILKRHIQRNKQSSRMKSFSNSGKRKRSSH